MRMLKTVLWHQRASLYTNSNQVFPKVENTLCQFRGPLVAILILVTTPDKFCECSGTRPQFLRYNYRVDLFGPQRCDGALYKRFLAVGQVESEIVVVDALPCLVWCTPRTASAAPVEVRRAVCRIGVNHDVVPGIVSNPASISAVEVHEVGTGNDDAVTLCGEIANVIKAVVPSLEDNVFGDNASSSHISGELDIFPHDESLVCLRAEVWQGSVDPDFVEIAH